MGTTTKEIGSSSFNDMISSVDRRSEYVENRAGANVRLNNFLTPYTLDDKSSILNAPCGYSNGVYASLRPSDARGPELLTSFTNGTTYPLDTFVSSGNNITSMIKSSGFGGCVSNGVSYNENDKVVVSFTYTKNSGNDLRVLFSSVNTGAGAAVTTSTNISDSGEYKLSFTITSTGVAYLQLGTGSSSHSINASITNVSIKKDTSADFDFVRGTAATRVTKDGLVKDVQILSDDLVQNGNFEEIGPELISNGDFSQQGSELVTGNNSNFDSSTGDWQQFRGVMSWDSSIQAGKWTDNGNTGSPKGFTMSGGVIPTSSGKIYRVKFIAKTDSSSSFDFDWIGESSTFNTISNPNLTSDFQDYEFTFTASGNNQRLYIALNNSTIGNGESYWIDNVSIFEVGQDWTIGSGWSIGDGKLVSVNGANYVTRPNATIVSGKTYKISYEVKDYVSGTFGIRTYTVGGITATANGTYTDYITSNGPTIELMGFGTFNGSVTNISVKEVLQDWKVEDYGAVSASAVITPEDGGVKLEKTSNDDWRSSFLVQSMSYTVGSKYKVTFSLKNGNISGIPNLYLRDNYQFSSRNIANIRTLTNDWVEYTYYFEATSASDDISIGNVNWQNAGAGEYFYIDNFSIIEITDDTNLPRIDYTNGTGALLLEPQSTNLIRYSEDFTNAAWTGFNYTITPNYAVSPDGSNNASRYVGSTNSQDFYIAVTVTSDYTYSFYVKAINAPFIRLRTTNGSCWFDMGNKTVGTNTFTGDANIQNVGNDWYRISVTTSHTTNSINAYIHAHATDNTTNELDGCEFLLWGAQLEQLPYPTSYIPTNGSTVTRNQDTCNNAGSSNLINSTEGVLYTEYKPTFAAGSRQITISDGTFDNRVIFECRENGTKFKIYVFSSGVSQAEITFPIPSLDNFYKIAIKYKANDVSFYVNGELKGTDTIATMPIGLNVLAFSGRNDSNLRMTGNIRSLAVFNEALTDEELAKITSTTQQEVFYEMRDKMQQIDADYYEFGDYTTRLKKLF